MCQIGGDASQGSALQFCVFLYPEYTAGSLVPPSMTRAPSTCPRSPNNFLPHLQAQNQ